MGSIIAFVRCPLSVVLYRSNFSEHARFGESLQAEGEADAMVVARAAQHVGQAVVSTSAAHVNRSAGSGNDQLEDHLGIKADASAEAHVELDARPLYASLAKL